MNTDTLQALLTEAEAADPSVPNFVLLNRLQSEMSRTRGSLKNAYDHALKGEERAKASMLRLTEEVVDKFDAELKAMKERHAKELGSLGGRRAAALKRADHHRDEAARCGLELHRLDSQYSHLNRRFLAAKKRLTPEQDPLGM